MRTSACGSLLIDFFFPERIPSTNLIDLNSELPSPSMHAHNYVNDIIFNPRPAPRDVFDMRKYYIKYVSVVLRIQIHTFYFLSLFSL